MASGWWPFLNYRTYLIHFFHIPQLIIALAHYRMFHHWPYSQLPDRHAALTLPLQTIRHRQTTSE